MDNIKKEIVSKIVNRILYFYRNHYMSEKTWNFFIENATNVLNGELELSEFLKMGVSEPSETEIDYSWRL